jgi:hypothetical protein
VGVSCVAFVELVARKSGDGDGRVEMVTHVPSGTAQPTRATVRVSATTLVQTGQCVCCSVWKRDGETNQWRWRPVRR